LTGAAKYTRPRYAWLIAGALAIGVLWANYAAPVSLAGGDTLWSVPVAYSVVHQRNVTLDEFPDLVQVTHTHTKVLADGHRVSLFPWGPSIASAPLVGAYDVWLHLRGSSLREYLTAHWHSSTTFPDARLEKELASIWATISTVVLFFLLLRRTRSRLLAVLVSLAFAFATSMFSTVSRALWSHTPSVLFLLLGVYFLQVFEDRAEWRAPRLQPRGALVAFASGASLGAAFFMRPTSAVPLAVLLVALFVREWRAGLAALAGAAIPVGVMFAIDYATLGSLLQPYYQPDRAAPGSSFLEGLAGNLVSPARGLLIWSPFVLVAIPAAVRAVRRPGRDRVMTVCVAVVVLHWLSIATLKPWWAGWSVGPRLFSDVLPFLMLLVADGVLFLRDRLPRRWIQPAMAIGAVLVAFSLFTNIRAATHFSVQLWNRDPLNVDTHSDRPWDWSDPQFLR
jgi:hypothetical protein